MFGETSHRSTARMLADRRSTTNFHKQFPSPNENQRRCDYCRNKIVLGDNGRRLRVMAQVLEQSAWMPRGPTVHRPDILVVSPHLLFSAFLSSPLSILPQSFLLRGGRFLHRADICLRPVFDNIYTYTRSFRHTIATFLIVPCILHPT